MVWIIGRILYLTGYSRAAEARSTGFGIQALATAVLLFSGSHPEKDHLDGCPARRLIGFSAAVSTSARSQLLNLGIEWNFSVCGRIDSAA